ncbi:MAG: phosphomannose isomerase type II C-terminal cupin domain [Christensenellaceae bacterium]|jgi:mannose-6-phosphate isomerase-like protein (cupin superfamily)|nr:phosphomannose isomerase type II C-terminal cupin domain [Christensenellaceae bacterium]
MANSNYNIGDHDTRPWGKWAVVHLGQGFIVKQITVNPGGILSLQRHKYRAEHWVITQGHGTVTLDDRKVPVSNDTAVYIPIGAWHRIQNDGRDPLVFIEVQTGDTLDESDIERRDDKYNRT